MPYGATQDRWVIMERSDRMWSTGEGNGKPLQYSCLPPPKKRGFKEIFIRSNPTSKEQWMHRRRRAKRSYSTIKVRRGGSEEIPLVQGKEQWLCFAGAAMKRYPTSKVRATQVKQ